MKANSFWKPVKQGKWDIFNQPKKSRIIGAAHTKGDGRWAHKGVTMEREKSTYIKMMKPEKFLRTTYMENKMGSAPQFTTYKMIGGKLAKDEKGNPIVKSVIKNPTYKQWEERVIEKERIPGYKRVISSKIKEMDIPYLEYDVKGKPTGHEGRHRAVAARELGIKLMPVTIGRELKNPRERYQARSWKVNKEKNWRNIIDEEDAAISSASADIPLKEQKTYGIEQPSVLQRLQFEKKKEKVPEYASTKRLSKGMALVSEVRTRLKSIYPSAKPEDIEEILWNIPSYNINSVDDAMIASNIEMKKILNRPSKKTPNIVVMDEDDLREARKESVKRLFGGADKLYNLNRRLRDTYPQSSPKKIDKVLWKINEDKSFNALSEDELMYMANKEMKKTFVRPEPKVKEQKVLKVQNLGDDMARTARVKKVKPGEDIFEQLGIERVGERYSDEDIRAEPKTTMTAQELIDEA